MTPAASIVIINSEAAFPNAGRQGLVSALSLAAFFSLARKILLPMAACVAASATPASEAPAALEAANVVWTSPSENAAGSMPLGNGEVVLNAWVEKQTGDLLILVAPAMRGANFRRLPSAGQAHAAIGQARGRE